MFLPLLLITAAIVSAGAVAYGTDPFWVQFQHGLQFVLWTRRLQWPLVTLSLLCCIATIALTIGGRRRAWWLLGLAPVLALFAHRFALGPAAGMMLAVENPAFVAADKTDIKDEDWVVGLGFGEGHFAYALADLYSHPVVLQADRDHRMMLIWSAFANRALAFAINQELRARDLEIVSTPANSLLIYNNRRGQFIIGVSGQTTDHESPRGFLKQRLPIATWKMPWGQWKALHPDAQAMAMEKLPRAPMPTSPLAPNWPMPPMKLDRPADTRVALVGGPDPLAFESDLVTIAPFNTKADGIPVVLFLQKPGEPIRAFDRRILNSQGKLDLIAHFTPIFRHKLHPAATMVDEGSNTGWNADGLCTDAPPEAKAFKGRRLDPIGIDDILPWNVMQFWYPNLQLETPPAAPSTVEPDQNSDNRKASRRKTRKPR